MNTSPLDSLLLQRGLSLAELAKAAHLSPKALYNLRQGHVRKARISTVSRLAEALHVSPVTLFEVLLQEGKLAGTRSKAAPPPVEGDS